MDDRDPHRKRSFDRAPVNMLSVRLLSTYMRINELYYLTLEAQQANHVIPHSLAPPLSPSQRSTINSGYDDENNDYIVKNGEVFAERYTILEVIGKGSYGQVVQAWDSIDSEYVAIKIIKNKPPFYNQGLSEMKVLNHIRGYDPTGRFCVVEMKNHFVFRNHLCIVFELLSRSLYDLLRSTRFSGVSLPLVRKFAFQLFRALYFLSSPNVGVIHADIKPENILLRNPKQSVICVIDFGSSCRRNERMYKYIQSRFYRSPEILLELEYGPEIDVWSAGCVIAEMHIGEPLFNGENEVEQIHKICEYLGLPPRHMIEASPKGKKFFRFNEHTGGWELRQSDSPVHRIPGSKSLQTLLGVHTGGPTGRRLGEPGHSDSEYEEFHDIISKMLTFDPSERLNSIEGFHHPFFSQPQDQENITTQEVAIQTD